MTPSSRTPLNACRSALINGFRNSAPKTALDEKGYVSEASLNLIEGVHLADFDADFRQGDGNELAGKFSAQSTSLVDWDDQSRSRDSQKGD